jgi:hypothetical protein
MQLLVSPKRGNGNRFFFGTGFWTTLVQAARRGYSSRFSFRFPQCVPLRSGLNTRGVLRWIALQHRDARQKHPGGLSLGHS